MKGSKINKVNVQLYDIAKQIVQLENPMDPIQFTRKINEVTKNMIQKKYWMLLCRERTDFTVFSIDTESSTIKKISKELIPTLRNRGQVLLIDEQPDGAFEIWIRDPETEENFAYYLFNYENGIIEC